MTGIYKITSPTGIVYIGQSWNIKRRWNSHKCFQHKTMAIGHSMKGMVANNKGIPHSEEHRLKISVANRGRKPSEQSVKALIERNKKRTGFTPWNKGKEWSEEAKLKMSNSHKGKKLSKESIQKRTLTRYGKMPK